MADNSFTIGATVDVAELQAGMNAGAETVQEALDKMLVSFQEASPAAARAVARISEDTRAAAVDVGESWQRMARASLAYNASLKEVSAATYLARKSGEDDAAALNLLAAAKEKAALASKELAAAQAAAVGENEAESLSVKELTGAFGGLLSSFLGIGIGVGMFGHLINGSADFNVQMHNLSLTTGISAATLAGLHDVVKEMGGDFDGISVGLSKMLKAQQDAVDGSKKQIEGFHLMGIEVKELKTLNPEELLFRLSEGFQKSGSSAEKNTAAIDVFGRGGRALIPVFEAAGASLRNMTEEEAKASGITDESTEASLKWKSVTEELNVTLRKLGLETLPAITAAIPYLAEAVEGVLAPFKTLIDVVDTLVLNAIESVIGLANIVADVVAGDFKRLASDASEAKNRIVAEWKSAGKDIAEAWTGAADTMFKSLSEGAEFPQAKKGGEDLPGLDETGKDTRLEQWRSELQAKKDAEDGFHELSKSEEAKFWESKLAIAKGDSKLYAEVYHEMRAAERDGQKLSLKEEEDVVRERLAATKQGSAERVAILREEVNHLKSIGADQTEDFKRTQTELVAAVRAYAEEQGKAAVEAERRKVEATRKGSEDRVAAERAVLAELKSLGLEETNEYTAQLQRVTDAVRGADEERVKLQELDIEQVRISGQARVQLEKQNVQAEFDLHRLNAQQRVAALKELEDQEYAIEKAAIEKKLALLAQDPTTSPVMIQRLYNEIENLTREHNNRLAALNTQGVKESQQKFDQFFERINTGFTSAINGMMSGAKSFVKGMEEIWNSMVTSLVDYIAKLALQWAEQHLVMRAISVIFHTQDVASQAAAEQAKTVATAKGTAQRGALEDLALAKTIVRHLIEIVSHVAKELAKTVATVAGVIAREAVQIAAHLKEIARAAIEAAVEAFKWVMAVVPYPVNLFLAPAAAAGAFAGVMSFASAAGGAFLSQDTILHAHQNEMVLPAPLSMGFKNIIGQMSAHGASGSGGAGGNVTHQDNRKYGDTNVTVHQTNNKMTPEEIASAVRIARRNGHL